MVILQALRRIRTRRGLRLTHFPASRYILTRMSNNRIHDYLFVNKTVSSQGRLRSAPNENATILSYVQRSRRSTERARRARQALYASTCLLHSPGQSADHAERGTGSRQRTINEGEAEPRHYEPRLPSQYPTHNPSDPFHSTVAGPDAGNHLLLRCTFDAWSRWIFLAEGFAPASLRTENLVTRHDRIMRERQRRCIDDAILMYATLGYGSGLLTWTTGMRDGERPPQMFIEKALKQLRQRLSDTAPVVDDWLLISIYSLAIAEMWNGSPSLWEKIPNLHALATATEHESLQASRTHLGTLCRLVEEQGGWDRFDPYLLDCALLADKYLAISHGKRPILLSSWTLPQAPDSISNIDLESFENTFSCLGRNLISEALDEQLKRVLQSVVEHARIADMVWETRTVDNELEQWLFRRHQRFSLRLHQLSFDCSSARDQCICLTALIVLLGSTSTWGPPLAAQIPAARLQKKLLALGIPSQKDGLRGDLLLWILFSGAISQVSFPEKHWFQDMIRELIIPLFMGACPSNTSENGEIAQKGVFKETVENTLEHFLYFPASQKEQLDAVFKQL